MARVVEDQVVEFSLDEVQSMKFRTSRTLLGRLFSETTFTASELREGLLETWRVQGNLRVLATKFGLFEIILPSDEMRVWLLKRSPWIVKDRILHLRSWTPSITRPIFDDLAFAPFRVQLWNVKEDCCTKQYGRKVAAGIIGQVLEADVFSAKDTDEHFVKVLALIDLTKPLRSQFMAISEEIGSFWVNLKYEFLPTFCYHCGRVGHSKPECVFGPPTSKEHFGPHMSTRKTGMKIYREDEDYPQFRNASKTVWVNRNTQLLNDGAEKVASRFLGTKTRPIAQVASLPISRESEAQKKRETQTRHQAPSTNSLGGRAIPKRFVFKTSPQVKIGGSVRQQQKKASPRKVVPPPRQGTKGRQQPSRSAKQASHCQQVVGQMEEVFEHSRRHRLILQEEFEEEEEIIGGGFNPPMKLRTSIGLAEKPDTKPKARPRLRKGGADCSLNSAHKDGGSTPSGDLLDVEEKEFVATLEKPADVDQQHDFDSDDDQAVEEHHSFEIKRRSPAEDARKTRHIRKGRVHQVVEAFESGLVIAMEENDVFKGVSSRLNEYGSSMMDPIMENRKRVLDELEGDVGNPPTPKKQFVESLDVLDKVDEASLEWPQEDK
ncbi:unnamed protein product [Linum trigynum]|uniref:CCHC-type domain-containing protein n=1 Tax=Linum trigynum TaxID=586398 RepID=A0AAV2FTB9_9ROSI